MLHRLDLSVTQDFSINIKVKERFQFRADILNFTNLLNKDWGVTQRVTNANILSYSTTVGNVPYYRMATTRDESGATILIKDTYQKNASTFDVYAQFTLRYTFGK
jgi:hypothetical protein